MEVKTIKVLYSSRVDIEERPKIVEQKTRLGDWEADLIVGSKHRGNIVTIVERKSRMLLAGILKNKSSKEVRKKLSSLLLGVKDRVHTITFDNGREFSEHYKLAESCECQTYFSGAL